MLKFEVLRETVDRGGVVETFTRTVWLDAGEVFAVEADADPKWAEGWAVLVFKPSAGRRAMTVEGSAEAVALAIGAEKDRQRRPVRRMWPITTGADQVGSERPTRG